MPLDELNRIMRVRNALAIKAQDEQNDLSNGSRELRNRNLGR